MRQNETTAMQWSDDDLREAVRARVISAADLERLTTFLSKRQPAAPANAAAAVVKFDAAHLLWYAGAFDRNRCDGNFLDRGVFSNGRSSAQRLRHHLRHRFYARGASPLAPERAGCSSLLRCPWRRSRSTAFKTSSVGGDHSGSRAQWATSMCG